MIAKLIVPISQNHLMNDDNSVSVMMSMPSTETLMDCSDSWTDRDGIGYECMSRSWGMGFEVSIIERRSDSVEWMRLQDGLPSGRLLHGSDQSNLELGVVRDGGIVENGRVRVNKVASGRSDHVLLLLVDLGNGGRPVVIAKHPCVRTFLNGLLHAAHGFSMGNLCSGSWTIHMAFTIWSQRVPNSPRDIFDRYKSLSWESGE